ncbi:MAG: hypothetical protein NTW10_07095 [Bacteroidetes bacterium]|nr:hypothetical protein [Bacteroidota bacterium]
MKTSCIHLSSEISKNERGFIKSTFVKIGRYLLLITAIFSIAMLTSCMFPGPGHSRPPQPGNEHHGHGNGQGHGEHHGNDDHLAN